MPIYALYAPDFNGTLLKGLRDVSIAPQITTDREQLDGNVYARNETILAAQRQYTLESLDVAAALGFTGTYGANVTTVELFERLKATGGGFTAGNVHVKRTLATGYAIPRTLNVPNQANASLSFDIIGYNATGTNPETLAASQPIGTAGDELLGGDCATFSFGSLSVNSNTLTGISNVSLDFGITEQIDTTDGNVWPSVINTMFAAPVLTITTTDASTASTLTSIAALTALTFKLRKRAAAGAFVADATEEHVSFSSSAGLVVEVGASGQRREYTFRIELQQDGDGTAPLTIDTTAAL